MVYFVGTDKFIISFLVVLITVILILNLGVHVSVVSGVSHKEHVPYDSVLLSMLEPVFPLSNK